MSVPTLTRAVPGQPEPPARLALEGDRLIIHNLQVSDPDVLATARRHSHPDSPDAPGVLEGFVTTALAVGAKALAVAGSTVDLAELDRSVSRLSQQVASSTQAALTRLDQAVTAATHAQTGTIPTSEQTALSGLAEQLTALLAGSDAPVRTAVADTVRHSSPRSAPSSAATARAVTGRRYGAFGRPRCGCGVR